MMRTGRTMSERRCKRKKGKRRMIAALAVLICLFGLVTGQAETAWADETPPDRGLSGQVSLLRQDDNDYIMQVRKAFWGNCAKAVSIRFMTAL